MHVLRNNISRNKGKGPMIGGGPQNQGSSGLIINEASKDSLSPGPMTSSQPLTVSLPNVAIDPNVEKKGVGVSVL